MQERAFALLNRAQDLIVGALAYGFIELGLQLFDVIREPLRIGPVPLLLCALLVSMVPRMLLKIFGRA